MKTLFLIMFGITFLFTHSCEEPSVTTKPMSAEDQQFIEMLDSMTTVHTTVLNAIDSTRNDSFAASR